MNIAVIPARGGSKRVPRKNIKHFCGKPMIAWSLEVAKTSGLFHHIIVSTDDIEIAEICRQLGAEVPFMRPAQLADDYTSTTDVINHATQWALDHGWRVDAVCCIYPTAPFLEAEDLRKGFQALSEGDWAYVFSATDYASPVYRAFIQSEAGGVEMVFPEHFTTRSQDLPYVLHDAGQFYWGRVESWLSKTRVFSGRSLPLYVPRHRVQDIDTKEDWLRAELMFRAFKQLQEK